MGEKSKRKERSPGQTDDRRRGRNLIVGDEKCLASNDKRARVRKRANDTLEGSLSE